MEITILSDNYSGAFGNLVYRITGADPEQVTEIEVIAGAGGEVLGIKRFAHDRNYDVNIANYIRRKMKVEPFYSEVNGLFVLPGRSVHAHIKCGSLVSQERVFTAGVTDATPMSVLSNAPGEAEITKGDMDELSMIVPEGRRIAVSVRLVKTDNRMDQVFSDTVTGDGNMYSLVVNSEKLEQYAMAVDPDNTLESYRYMDVVYEEDGGQPVLMRRYVIKQLRAGSVRLCWINPYGAIDYYTFDVEDSERIVNEKNRIYTDSGYKAYGSITQRIKILLSQAEDKDTIGWLSEIFCSPAVWVSEGSGFEAVDILTNEAVMTGHRPGILSLTVRGNRKKTYQTF